MDRQHPRDLFDVRDLLANEGVDDALRCAFVLYLASHNLLMTEVLAPTRKSISEEYLRGFEGMTADPISPDEPLFAKESLIETVVGGMPQRHRQFLISFERGEPDWELLLSSSIATPFPDAAVTQRVHERQQFVEFFVFTRSGWSVFIEWSKGVPPHLPFHMRPHWRGSVLDCRALLSGSAA